MVKSKDVSYYVVIKKIARTSFDLNDGVCVDTANGEIVFGAVVCGDTLAQHELAGFKGVGFAYRKCRHRKCV